MDNFEGQYMYLYILIWLGGLINLKNSILAVSLVKVETVIKYRDIYL